MTGGRFRSLRFVHPDLAEGVRGLQVAAQGGLATVTDGEAVRQALLLLLTTRPGERVGRPSYGCDLARLVFAPVDDTTAGLAIHYVRQAVTRWEPRVEVVDVDASPTDAPAPGPGPGQGPGPGPQLLLHLTYRVRLTRETDVLSLTLPLAGGAP